MDLRPGRDAGVNPGAPYSWLPDSLSRRAASASSEASAPPLEAGPVLDREPPRGLLLDEEEEEDDDDELLDAAGTPSSPAAMASESAFRASST